LGLEEAVEVLEGQQLVAHAGAVGLDPGVLPGRSGVDVFGLGAGESAPVAQRVGGELWSVAAPDVLGAPAPGRGDLVQARHCRVRVYRAVHQIGEGLPGELVDHVADLDLAARCGDVELVVQRPHVVRAPGFEQSGAGV